MVLDGIIDHCVIQCPLNSEAAPAPPNNPALMRLNQLWPLPLRR
jgi:hypothetical protein